MERLAAHARSVYSQFGEDGMVEHLLSIIGVQHRRCAEIGAHDGTHLSNTARWWRDEGWSAVLAECDMDRARKARIAGGGYDVAVIAEAVGPGNVNALIRGDFDLMSIDVDGDEWWIWSHMESRPRILIVEFNQSIPHWIDARPPRPGSHIGASARALERLGLEKGYIVVGAVGCNLLFVRRDLMSGHRFEWRLEELIGTAPLTYLVTDYRGRMYPLGAEPPWGLELELTDQELMIG